jgi:hypothetical protein
MSIAEKLQLIAENEQKVFNAGKQAEHDAFWDAFQQNGERNNYGYAFYTIAWTDEIYNPKYDFVVKLANMMFGSSQITNIKKTLDVSGYYINQQGLFSNCTKLVTIPKIIVAEDNYYTNWFAGCTALENITFEGTIANDISFADSKNLSLESLRSIIDALKDCYHQEDEWTHNLTISKASKDKLDEEMASGGWDYALRYIEDKAWNLEVL